MPFGAVYSGRWAHESMHYMGSRSDESIYCQQGWQDGDAAFCQNSSFTCSQSHSIDVRKQPPPICCVCMTGTRMKCPYSLLLCQVFTRWWRRPTVQLAEFSRDWEFRQVLLLISMELWKHIWRVLVPAVFRRKWNRYVHTKHCWSDWTVEFVEIVRQFCMRCIVLILQFYLLFVVLMISLFYLVAHLKWATK